MRDSRSVRDYDEKLREFRRIRKQLADYIEIITTEFGESGLSVHAILGKSILTNERLSGLSNEALERCNIPPEMQTAFGFSALLQLGSQIEKAHSDTLASEANWKETRLAHPDRFTVEEACALAKRASDEALALAQARDTLEGWGINDNEDRHTLSELKDCLGACGDHLQRHSKSFLLEVLTNGNADFLASFLKECVALTAIEEELASQLTDEPDDTVLWKIRKVEDVCIRASLSTVDEGALAEQLKYKRNSAGTAHSISAALGPLIAACEPAKTWLLDDIAKAHELCREAGREALAIRTAKFLEGNATYHLRELCGEGRELQRERAALSEQVNLSIEVSLDALIACASTFRTTGPLAFLSSTFRSAKRLFKSISRSGAYSKAEAIQILDRLIAFRRKSNDFAQQMEASSFFGRYYRGLDTKYEPFERIANYLDRLVEHFGEPKHATLYAFLSDAAVKQLDLLPAVPSTGVPITFTTLSDRIAVAEVEAALLERAIADLQDVAGVLITRRIGLAEIQNLKRRLETLLLGRGRVDDHSVARELLGNEFDGHRTKAEHFEPAVAWAQSAGALASLVRTVLSRGDPIEICRSIEVTLIAEEALKATLIRLAEIAKIDPESFMRGRTLSEAAEALEKASSDSEGLFAFATFASSVLEAAPHGIMPLVNERLGAGSLVGLGGQVWSLPCDRLLGHGFRSRSSFAHALAAARRSSPTATSNADLAGNKAVSRAMRSKSPSGLPSARRDLVQCKRERIPIATFKRRP